MYRRMEENKNPSIKVEQIKVKPKFIAQGCPVCNTWGTLRSGTKICQGCNGKGYILIPAEEIKHE